MGLAQLGVFSLLSMALIVFTLKRRHPYRFYRFIAFECLLAIILLNSENWFVSPFSGRQIVSWVLLIGSMILALHGFWVLRSLGRPEGDIEDTTQLVEQGAFRYVRHPLYGSLLLCGIGAFLKSMTIWGLILLATLTAFLYATARVEEKDNMKKFGVEYQEYQRRTKMFIPFLY